MAYTQNQIDTLKTAMAAGVLTVRHGESMTTFQSLPEMRKQLAVMEADVADTARPRRTVAAFSNGC